MTAHAIHLILPTRISRLVLYPGNKPYFYDNEYIERLNKKSNPNRVPQSDQYNDPLPTRSDHEMIR